MLDVKVKDLFVESDHMKVFKKAIQNGLPNPEDYMYMYSRVLGGGSIIMDCFKHIDTRESIIIHR